MRGSSCFAAEVGGTGDHVVYECLPTAVDITSVRLEIRRWRVTLFGPP